MRFDTIIQDVQIIDGTGRRPFHNDVGIKDGRIHSMGVLSEAESERRIDGAGLSLCPGFIDVHSHADMTAVREDHPKLFQPLLQQGITTLVGGNCGVAMAPISGRNPESQMLFYDFFLGEPQEENIRWSSFADLMDTYDRQGLALNMGMLAPHSILRMDVLGVSTDSAKTEHLKDMKRSLSQCLEAGALGISTGLQYPAGLSSDEWELTELARVVHKYNGVFTSHLRSYSSDTISKAIEEVLSIGRSAEVPVQISHLFWIPNYRPPLNHLLNRFLKTASRVYRKAEFPININSALAPHLEKIGELIRKGFPIGMDSMPTGSGFTHILALFPPWSLQGGLNRVRERLASPKERARIRHSIENGDTKWPHRERDSWSMNLFKLMGWDCAYIMSMKTDKNRSLIGRSISDIARERGRHPFDCVCDLLLDEDGRILIFESATYPGDPMLERISQGALLDPNVSVVTDSILLGFGLPSHLFYDCYPKFLGEYSRERGLLSLTEAIRKCTSLPARQLGIRSRGEIREGYFADLVLFNPSTIASRSTHDDPEHFPEGIHYVIVNGEPVVGPQGYNAEAKAGRLIRRGDC